jgi:hypothetical protein
VWITSCVPGFFCSHVSKLNIVYYGHNVDINPSDLVDRVDLEPETTEEQIDQLLAEKLSEMIEEALACEPASYTFDGSDTLERAKELLAKQRQEDEAETPDPS